MPAFDPALFDPALFDSAAVSQVPSPLTLFDPSLFDPAHFDTDLVLTPGPIPPPVVVRKGVAINAYKQFKFIDRRGNTYYVKRG